MFRPTTRARFARASATTIAAAAFRRDTPATLLRSRIFFKSFALRGVTAQVAAGWVTAAGFPFRAACDTKDRSLDATVTPAVAGVVDSEIGRVAVTLCFTPVTADLDASEAAAALRRAARSILLTRRIAMPCLPLLTNISGVLLLPAIFFLAAIISADRVRSSDFRRLIANGVTEADWGRIILRTRMSVLFLNLLLRGREERLPRSASRLLQSARSPLQGAHRDPQFIAGCP